MSVNELAKLMV